MKKQVSLFLMAMLVFGCAKVRVEVPKDPIKLDITMRLDVYQHVTEDIDKIEDFVTGSNEKPQPPKVGNQSFLLGFVTDAYAEEEMSPQVKEAAQRRKDRRSEIVTYLQTQVIGENKEGMLEIRSSLKGSAAVQQLITDENNDRLIIYQGVAENNGTSLEEVRKIYTKKLQATAPEGSWIETQTSSGEYQWKQK